MHNTLRESRYTALHLNTSNVTKKTWPNKIERSTYGCTFWANDRSLSSRIIVNVPCFLYATRCRTPGKIHIWHWILCLSPREPLTLCFFAFTCSRVDLRRAMSIFHFIEEKLAYYQTILCRFFLDFFFIIAEIIGECFLFWLEIGRLKSWKLEEITSNSNFLWNFDVRFIFYSI